ncbi:hypothetical protein GCK32_020435 [Trichostrongylus colubriformis]|uniref:Uncharacterized protein n=1 Tax=Trichostrongylus colubriformis TaxID=6319 RepID=A0AAN8F8F0_TRICO
MSEENKPESRGEVNEEDENEEKDKNEFTPVSEELQTNMITSSAAKCYTLLSLPKKSSPAFDSKATEFVHRFLASAKAVLFTI